MALVSLHLYCVHVHEYILDSEEKIEISQKQSWGENAVVENVALLVRK